MPIRIRRREVLLASVMMIACDLMEAPRSAEATNNSTWLLSYQGKLVGVGGLPATGSHTLVFSITSPTNITWTETQPVTTTSGLFHVLLGQVTPFPDHLFSGGPVDLTITVDGKAMAPNTHLSASPYAFEALHSAQSDMATQATVAQGVAAGAVTSDSIKDGSITATKMSPGAVTTDSIKDGSVTASKIGSAAVGTDSINDGSVTTSKIGSGAVISDGIKDGSITASKMGTAAVTTDSIQDGSVTASKMSPGAFIPVGGVIAWWGDSANVPGGWKACDGTAVNDPASSLNGMAMPDLRNRFIRGATGNTLPTAPTGGADTRTISVDQLPSHSHGVTDPGHTHDMWGMTWVSITTNNGQNVPNAQGSSILPTPIAASPTGISIQATGSGQPIDIVPSYVGLIYIMRVH